MEKKRLRIEKKRLTMVKRLVQNGKEASFRIEKAALSEKGFAQYEKSFNC